MCNGGTDSGFLSLFLVVANRFFASLVPADIAEVNQTVDVARQTNEDTEVRDRLDRSGNLVACRVL